MNTTEKKAWFETAFNKIQSIAKWSEEQIAIFTWLACGIGNLVIRARAGTGKTFTITYGIHFIPQSIQSILYAVFNKKNQLEAQAKITDPRVKVTTFHALGYSIILSHWPRVKPDNFVERDRVQSVCPDIPSEVVTQVCRLVAFLKNGFINPTLDEARETMDYRGIECSEKFESWNARLPQLALDAMEKAKTRDYQGRISFDDMIWLPVAMGWVQKKFDFVFVDECQDMNLPQLTMAVQSCKDTGQVCLTGDDRQAMYGFRGAMCNGIDIFKARLNADELGLTTTYRCPKKVVALASQLVPDYKVADSAPEGIVENINDSRLLETVQIGDAILSRINAPLMKICLSLLKRNVSARIEGRDIGKTLCNIVRDIRAKSVPDFMTRIEAWQTKQIARCKGKNAESKIETIHDQTEMLVSIAEVASSVADIETRLNSLFVDSDYATKPAVVLSSVHKAKGLEWPNVYLLADTFKRNRPNTTPDAQREEQNIYYVALTRAKNKLTFVGSQPTLGL